MILDKVVKISKNGFKNLIEKAKIWRNATMGCTDLKSTDRCERADEFLFCIVLKLEAQGLEPSSFLS